MVAAGLVLAGRGTPPDIAVVYGGRTAHGIAALTAAGLDGARREHDFNLEEVVPPFTDLPGRLRSLAANTDLVIVADQRYTGAAEAVANEFPETTWAYLERPVPGAPSTIFADHQGAYLVGAAAARKTGTGTIGFVGGLQFDTVESFRAGYEAGARTVLPDVRILARYVSLGLDGFTDDQRARDIALEMYRDGADVVFHAAGSAGLGVFDAARAHKTETGQKVWGIGVDSDQYLEVDSRLQEFVLTSMVKKYDVAVQGIIDDFLAGDLEPVPRVMTLADGGLDVSTTGNFLDDETRATIEHLERVVVEGRVTVPLAPSGAVDPPPGVTAATTLALTTDGTSCTYTGKTEFEAGEVVRIEYVNNSTTESGAGLVDLTGGYAIAAVPTPSQHTNVGYAALPAGRYRLQCGVVKDGTVSVIEAAILTAG
jgi:basic membrane protein A